MQYTEMAHRMSALSCMYDKTTPLRGMQWLTISSDTGALMARPSQRCQAYHDGGRTTAFTQILTEIMLIDIIQCLHAEVG